MPADALPMDMESLSHSGRIRRAVELGRRARTDPEAARTLLSLRTGGFTHRLLAAYACHGSRSAGDLATLCGDASRIIAGTAAKILLNVADDETILAVLRRLPSRRVPRCLIRLRRARPDVVDRFVGGLAEAGNDTAWPLIPLASPAVVDRHFASAAERGGVRFWSRLASLHPERAAAEIVARLDAATAPDGLLLANGHAVLAALADPEPDHALAVVASLHRHVPLLSISLQALIVRRPIPIADLILGGTDSASVDFCAAAPRLGVARLVALYRRSAHFLACPDSWLAKLPAADRSVVYQELAPAWTLSEGLIAPDILHRLPAELRVAEARRILGRPILATRPLGRLPYAGLLPWDEARAACQPWLGHPEAENRAAALVALGEATRFDRSKLGELLEVLAARKHEQDPVRSAFLAALAALPPRRWRTEHLPGLARLIRDALDAADLSHGGAAALGRLVCRLLPVHPEWAAGQLATLTAERGFPTLPGSDPFTADDIRRIAPVLTPVVLAWSAREREPAILELARAVGRRLPHWPELGAALEQLIAGSAHAFTASSAMTMIVEHLPARRERVVTETLARDGSWILNSEALGYVNARRQELLTPFLGSRTYSGRFSTGKVRNVLPVSSGFHRWTPHQQETFAETLAALTAAPANPKRQQVTSDVLSGVTRLALLPAIGPERLVALARDARPAVKEAAVRALGRLDARQGIPELLDALGDARARFAVYALRGALKDLPEARVLGVMRAVPFAKVTVAKEAVRLAGEFGGAESVGWFAELHALALHRDVRGALLRALWDHLERPEAWAILEASSADPDPGVVIGLARIQVDRASAGTRERVADLLLRLLDHPEPTVRVAVLDRLAGQPVPDAGRTLLAAALAMLGSAIPDIRRSGLGAALALATDADAERFAAAFAELFPRKRELVAAVEEFVSRTRYLGHRLVVLRSAVLAALEAEPALTPLQIPLAAARLAMEPFAVWVARLAETDRWQLGTQTAVANAVAGCGQPVEDLERAETAWASSVDPSLRWLALRVLIQVATDRGWTVARRARLDRYRLDASPWVAAEAELTFPPDDGVGA